MKKSLLAVAVLGAFAGSAIAADVTLYGIVDTGLLYKHIDQDVDGAKKINNFSMESGMYSGSRWGLKGAEELGNGYKVGFVLESGFSSDSGKQGQSRLFGRESTLWVSGPFGKVYAGRMGALIYGAGSVSKIGMLSAFGTSFNTYVPQVNSTMSLAGRWDNTLAYESPNFAGLTVRAQYSMGSDGAENKSVGNDKYAAIAATYANGPLNLFLGVDRIFYGHEANQHPDHPDDSLTVSFGGNYDFGVAKLFAGVQYFDEVMLSSFQGFDKTTYGSKFSGESHKVKGFGVNLSASAPVFGGTAMVGASYMDAESTKENSIGNKADIKRAQVSVGYDYAFSKRTDVYTLVSYGKDDFRHNTEGQPKQKPSYGVFALGLRHKF